MKNKIRTTILIAIIMIFSIQLSAQAVIISTDKTVQSGSGTVTISVTSNQSLGAYTLKLTDTAGLELTNASGGEVSSDKKTITGSSAEGTKNLGTFTFKVPTVDKDTTYNIKFSITGMETPSLDSIADETNTAVIIVKAPVIEKPQPDPEPETPTTPEPEEPSTPKELEFKTVNEKVYATGTVNVRESYSASAKSLGQLKQGESVTRTGISKTASEGYNWSKITFNGKTAYVISNKLTTTEPVQDEPDKEQPTNQEPQEQTPVEEPTIVNDNKDDTQIKDGLTKLEIEGLTLSPAFSPDIYEYRAILRKNISELEINAIPTKEGATLTIAGNDNLQEGENLITIVVYNAENQAATYQVSINKNTLDLSKADKMLQMGNQEAKRNATIYLVILTGQIVVLIILMILKHRNSYYEEDYDEEYPDIQELTENEQTVENEANKTSQEEQVEEISQEETEQEIRRPRREKRKGKHF